MINYTQNSRVVVTAKINGNVSRSLSSGISAECSALRRKIELVETTKLDDWRHQAAVLKADLDELSEWGAALIRMIASETVALEKQEQACVVVPLILTGSMVSIVVAVVLLVSGCVSQLTPKQQKAERGFWTAIVEAFTRGAVSGAVDSLKHDEEEGR